MKLMFQFPSIQTSANHDITTGTTNTIDAQLKTGVKNHNWSESYFRSGTISFWGYHDDSTQQRRHHPWRHDAEVF